MSERTPGQIRQRLRRIGKARAETAEAAQEAHRAGIPAAEIAKLLGYSSRKSVYNLIERGH